MPEVMDAHELAVIRRIANNAKMLLMEAARRFGESGTSSRYRELLKRQAEYQLAYHDLSAVHVPVL